MDFLINLTQPAMDSVQLFVSKGIFALLLLSFCACSSPKKVQDKPSGKTIPKSANLGADSTKSASKQTLFAPQPRPLAELDEATKKQIMQFIMPESDTKLTYENKSHSISVPIDMEQPFYIELSGKSFEKGRFDREKQVNEMRQVMRDFRKAQDLFYNGEYNAALESVSRSLATVETAEGMALKGTIYFLLRDVERARQYWDKARRLDPEIVVPSQSELEALLKRK